MPLPVVSPTLFNAQALAADPADTHLQSGIHLRVSANPLLGLPVAPFIVWRAISNGQGLKLRNDVVFVDSRGQVLPGSFTLTPDNPVTAYLVLPPGEVCIWARVLADPAGAATGAPIGRTTPGTSPAQPATGASPIQPVRTVREVLGGARLDGSRRVSDLTTSGRVTAGIRATAFLATSRGPSPFASRSAPAFAFAGPGIVQIRLEGQGAVVGVAWLAQRDVPRLDWAPWTVLNLPHAGGPRYLSIVDAVARAEARVLEQAPRRRPLQETIGAVPPGSSPVEPPVFDGKRVGSLVAPLGGDLDRLITDLSAPQLELLASDPLVDHRGTTIGSIDQRCIDRVFQAQFDPGTAAFFGYKALDRQYPDPQALLVFYWVAGLFHDFPPSARQPVVDPIFDAQLALLGQENRIGTEREVVERFRKLISGLPVKVDEPSAKRLEPHGNYIGLGALAIADRSAAPDPIAAPVIDRDVHVGWLPTVPPDAKREVQVFVSGVATAGLLAVEKQTPAGGTARASLHKTNRDGVHLPLILSQNTSDETLDVADAPGTGFIADRSAAATSVRCYVAQQDGFGRWSDWVSAVNNPGPRPGPPRPVLRGYYTSPSNPASAGGTIRVMVDVPTLESLAPASFPIARLELTATDETTSGVTSRTETIASPLAPPARLDFSFTGPVLAATEVRKMRLVAVWRDTAGTASVESEPQVLTLRDPRPPLQIGVPDELQYSGRPDVMGLSMVEYAWDTTPSQANFAVYYTDENRLVASLADAAAGSDAAVLRAALAGTSDPAARATLLRSRPDLFGAHLFERLQGVVSEAGANRKTFRHPVSGSLRVLNLYRLSAESSSNARVDLSTLPLLVFAVPNADPPSRPVLEVVPADMADNGDTYAAHVRITVTPAATKAAGWRLRRSSLGATERLRMPVVSIGAMGEPDPKDGRQRGEYVDEGPVQISQTATLQPWVRYHWIAEAQGDFAPGSLAAGRPVPGEWSQPSDPVSLMLVPPRPPEPPATLAAAGTSVGGGQFVGVTLTFTHLRSLSGGAMRPYRARIIRRVPGAPMETLAEVDVPLPLTALSGMRPGDASDVVASGTLYRLVLIDPLGRESSATDATLE